MALIKMIDTAHELKEEFISFDRDYFSMKACENIVNYYNILEENIVLDIIELCCKFNETDYETLKDEYDIDDNDNALKYLQDRTYAVDLGDTVLYMVF